MRILLITLPIRVNAPPTLYLGIAAIAAVLERDGHEVTILDICGHRWTSGEVERRLQSVACDAIGTGGMVTSYRYLKSLIPAVRRCHPGKPVVLGGPITSTTSDLLFARDLADVCVLDEGDDTAVELFRALETGRPLSEIKGIRFRGHHGIETTPPRPRILDLDRLPYPAYHLFDMNIYAAGQKVRESKGRRAMEVLTGRGCPFHCVYCKRNFGNRIALRSPAHVIGELRLLHDRYGIEYFVFVDELFILNRRRIFEFCDALDESGLRIDWGCLGRVNTVTREILERMKASGCTDVGYGIESLSQPILDEMRKGVTVEQARTAIRLTHEAGLVQSNTLMIGMPGETRDTVNETVRNYRQIDQLPCQFFFTCPYPGTDLYEQAKDRVLSRYGSEEAFIESLGDATEFVVNLTRMTDDELIGLKRTADRKILLNFAVRHPLWVARRVLSYLAGYGITRGLRVMWQHLIFRYGRSRRASPPAVEPV